MIRGFDESLHGGAGEDDHHPLTVRFLGIGKPIRKSLDDFVAGAPLASGAKVEIAALAFAPLAERIVESLHAAVKNASHEQQVSGNYVSMALRPPEIRHMMSQQGFESRLLGHLAHCLDFREGVVALGLAHHPLILQALRTIHGISCRAHNGRLCYDCVCIAATDLHNTNSAIPCESNT